MKRAVLCTLSLVLVAFAAGCGSGGNGANGSNNNGATSSSMVMSMGDATSDQVVTFALTVNSITLTGGSNPQVLNTPATLEFVHNAGTFQPLVQVDVPSGTYTGATLTLSNPVVVAIDPTTFQPVQLNATLSSSTVTVNFNNPLTVNSNVADVRFDLDLANTVTINGNTATITPTFTVTSKIVASDNDLLEVHGAVASVSSPQFTISSSQMSQMLTFTTNSNTQFVGITGLSQLTTGMTVRVVFTIQDDGSLLAVTVEAEQQMGDNDGADVEALVTKVTGNPATEINVINEFSSSPILNLLNFLGIGHKLGVNISNNTNFIVQDEGTGPGQVDVTGLSVAFDAGHIAADQNVDVDVDHQVEFNFNSITVNADAIRLEQQAIHGTISNASGSTPGSFTLTVDALSVFGLVTGQTTLTVDVQNNTFTNMTIANGQTALVRGLLFFDGTSYTLVASSVINIQ